MNHLVTSRPRSSRQQERGQILVMGALFLTTLLGFAGLAVDTGMLYTRRTSMQNATDSAALAAAEAMSVTGDRAQAIAAATDYMQRNGFTEGVGGAHISVDNAPTTGPHAGDLAFFEVRVTASVPTIFLKVLGTTLSDVGARSVAGVQTEKVLPYNFVALKTGCDNHTLLVKLGGTLTVDGGIYVNSGNGGGPTAPSCGVDNKGPGYGDGFDLFGTGGRLTAKVIKTVGGWETHDGDVVCITGSGCCVSNGPCTASPEIHQPVLADPLASLAAPVFASYTIRHGTAAAPSLYTIGSTQTLSPGVYYGGLKITGGTVTLSPGVYIMAGGGFSVRNSAILSADGVMIYNSVSAPGVTSGAGSSGPVVLDTTGSVTLKAQHVGPYGGLVIFQDRKVTENTLLRPPSLNGLAGTIYTPYWIPNKSFHPSCPTQAGTTINDGGVSTVVIDAGGTANLQVMSAQILVCSADATFHFDPAGLADSGLSLVE